MPLCWETTVLGEHFRDVEKDDKNASKPVARHFNLPNHSKPHMAVCSLSCIKEARKAAKHETQKSSVFESALLPIILTAPTNLFYWFSRYQAPTNSVTPFLLSGNRELTLKCKLKCYEKPMIDPLSVSPSKGNQCSYHFISGCLLLNIT